jgi:hypothetical protein
VFLCHYFVFNITFIYLPDKDLLFHCMIKGIKVELYTLKDIVLIAIVCYTTEQLLLDYTTATVMWMLSTIYNRTFRWLKCSITHFIPFIWDPILCQKHSNWKFCWELGLNKFSSIQRHNTTMTTIFYSGFSKLIIAAKL